MLSVSFDITPANAISVGSVKRIVAILLVISKVASFLSLATNRLAISCAKVSSAPHGITPSCSYPFYQSPESY